MPKDALFPISPSTTRFSSDAVIGAVDDVAGKYEGLTFFVADQLQLYNRASGASDEGIVKIFGEFDQSNSISRQRKSWLGKIRSRMAERFDVSKWRILSVSDVVDSQFFSIYRRVLISYCLNTSMHDDVVLAADEHVSSRQMPKAIPEQVWTKSKDSGISLSVGYILEEIALSIKFHVVDEIEDEYYMGSHLDLIIKLYAGQYGIDVFTLAGIPRRECEFRFFEYSSKLRDSGSGSWSLRNT